MNHFQGLTDEEVAARRSAGQGNTVSSGTSRTYWDIARGNLFSFFNNILFTVGTILAALGQYNDAFITVIVGIVNALRNSDKITYPFVPKSFFLISIFMIVN